MTCLLDRSPNLDNQQDFRIADLLVRAHVISTVQLSEAQQRARHERSRLGEILVNGGLVTLEQIQSAIIIHEMIKEGLDSYIAVCALQSSCQTGTSDYEALGQSSSIADDSADEQQKNVLGRILVDSQLITKDQLKRAIKDSASNGLSLGRLLVVSNELAEACLEAALELQVRINNGVISYEEAVRNLKEDRTRTLEETSLRRLETDTAALEQTPLRLEQLLVLSGILPREDLLCLLEHSVTTGRTIEDLLGDLGYVSESILEAALALRQMADARTITAPQAVVCLHYVYGTGASVERSFQYLGIEKYATRVEAIGCTYPGLASTTDPRLNAFVDDAGDGLLASSQGVLRQRHEIPTRSNTAFEAMHDTCTKIAQAYIERGQISEAEAIQRRLIAMTEKAMGSDSDIYCEDLTNLAAVLCLSRNFAEAVPLMRQAIATYQAGVQFYTDCRTFANRINMLADIYIELERYEEAKPLLSQTLAIRELYLEQDDSDLAYTLSDYARLLRKMQLDVEAEKTCVQAKSVSSTKTAFAGPATSEP